MTGGPRALQIKDNIIYELLAIQLAYNPVNIPDVYYGVFAEGKRHAQCL